MNASITGLRGVRDGVIHTGAVALMLGAALAMNTARAANDVDADDSIARPATRAPAPAAPAARAMPAPPAPSARAMPAPPPPSAKPAPTPDPMPAPSPREVIRERAEIDARTAAERADIDQRLHEAQERMNRAAAEIAAIASERAREAMENLPFLDGDALVGDPMTHRGPVIGVDLDPKSKGGARVLDVSPGGPAEEAGIRAGDVIVAINGKDVKADAAGESSRKVVRELQAFRGQQHGKDSEAKLKVQVLRDGKAKDFQIEPRRVMNTFVFTPPMPPMPPEPGEVGPFNFNFQSFGAHGDLAGLEVTTLTPQLGRYFGANKGVLVVRAPKSDTYKLQDGDVIVAIDGREPTSGSHITRILSSYQPGEQLTLRVMRDHKTQDIQVTVPDRRQSRVFPTEADAAM